MGTKHHWLKAGLMASLAVSLTTLAIADNSQPKLVEVANKSAIADRLIVKFKQSGLSFQKISQLNQMGVSVTKTIKLASKPGKVLASNDSNEISILSIDDGSNVKTAIAKLEKSGLVVYAEPDYVLTTADTIPDDASFDSLWGMNNTGQTGGTNDADIDAVEAWDIHTGNDSVVVAVVDTGVDYDHVDLSDNMWVNPGEIAGNGVDDDANGYVDDVYGIDCYNGDSDPFDDHSHGTHVAGTIGAKGDNGTGVVGVNWDTQIMALKFLGGSGSGSTAGAIECLNYAAAMAIRSDDPVNLKVTNNSWGGGGYSEALLDVFNVLGDADVLSAVAAGNDAYDLDTNPTYPAAYDADSIIAVASTDHNDDMSYFSSYGLTSVDIGAPGSAILSTVPGDSYASYNGTSMATPHVAGALAFLWSYDSSYTAPSLKSLIMSTGDPIPALTGTTVSGKRLNIFNSIGCVPGSPTLSITNPGNDFVVTSGEETSVQASVSDCGAPVTGESITAMFNTADPDVQLMDNGSGSDLVADDGIYTGSWTPSEAVASVTINAESDSGLSDSVSGQVISNYIISDATYDWVDATGGTEISINSDDTYQEVNLDFDFEFYGDSYSSLFVSSNGLISFGSGYSSYSNIAIPSTSTPNNFIAAFWDDLHMGYSEDSKAYIYTDGVAPNRRTIISWIDVKRFGYSSYGEVSFQVTLYEGSNDIVTQYKDVIFDSADIDYGANATLGVENADGTLGAQYSYNSIVIGNERAIKYSLNPDNGAIPMHLNNWDTAKRGWKFPGADELYSEGSVMFTFAGDGTDRELRLQGYDIDSDTELCIYLNGSSEATGCLEAGINNGYTSWQVFTLPIDSQVTDTNYVEVKARNPQSRWGFRNIGLFDFPRGKLPLSLGVRDRTAYGWDWRDINTHSKRVPFVTNISEPSEETGSTQYFFKLRGYDIDSNDEACVSLNGMDIGCIPAGDNNRLTRYWYFYLPTAYMQTGYNTLDVTQKTREEKWGIRDARVIPVSIPSEASLSELQEGPFVELPEGAAIAR